MHFVIVPAGWHGNQAKLLLDVTIAEPEVEYIDIDTFIHHM